MPMLPRRSAPIRSLACSIAILARGIPLRTTLPFAPQSGRYRRGVCLCSPPPASEARGGEGSGVGVGGASTSMSLAESSLTPPLSPQGGERRQRALLPPRGTIEPHHV